MSDYQKNDTRSADEPPPLPSRTQKSASISLPADGKSSNDMPPPLPPKGKREPAPAMPATFARYSEAGPPLIMPNRATDSAPYSWRGLPLWARNRWVWIGGVAVIVLILVANSRTPTSTSTTAGDPKARPSNGSGTPREVRPEPSISVSAAELVNDYKANEVAADARYKGKVVEVSGAIDRIGKDLIDTMYVSLSSGRQFEFRSVQCYFADSEEGKLSQLSNGQWITLKGRCDGLMGNVLVKECKIKD